MSVDDDLSLRIAALFRRGLQVESVRAATDLRGVSEVWPDGNETAKARWYVWLTTSPGAFELSLDEAERVAIQGMPCFRGLLRLRYFPSPAEPVFALLSQPERDALTSPLFDGTRTPAFGQGHRIPADWFTVAAIEVYEDPDLAASAFLLASTDPYAGPLTDLCAGASAADVMVPSWQLAYPLFEAIVGLKSYELRLGPSRIVCSRRPAACSGLDTKAAFVGFGVGAPQVAAVDHLAAVLRNDPWRLVCQFSAGSDGAEECGCHGHGARHRAPRPDHNCVRQETIPLPYSEIWWTLAAINDPLAALPCGCH